VRACDLDSLFFFLLSLTHTHKHTHSLSLSLSLPSPPPPSPSPSPPFSSSSLSLSLSLPPSHGSADIVADVLTFNDEHDWEAIVIEQSTEAANRAARTLIVVPHGGPHSAFAVEYVASHGACACLLY
jgi:hypothetical protein